MFCVQLPQKPDLFIFQNLTESNAEQNKNINDSFDSPKSSQGSPFAQNYNEQQQQPPPPPYGHAQYYPTPSDVTTSSPLKAQRPFSHQLTLSQLSTQTITKPLTPNPASTSSSLHEDLMSPQAFASEHGGCSTPTNPDLTSPMDYDLFYSKPQDQCSTQPLDFSQAPPYFSAPQSHTASKLPEQPFVQFKAQHQKARTGHQVISYPSLYSPLSIQTNSMVIT